MSKSVAPLSKQCECLTTYLRVLRGGVRRAELELQRAPHRSRYPLEDSLKWRGYQVARDTLLIAEACAHDLRKAQVLRLAPFQPGDQLIATLTVRGFPHTETRYAIWDVEPESRNRYSYQVVALTKRGALSKRGYFHQLMADHRHSLRHCSDPLDVETEAILRHRRSQTASFVEGTVNRGSLTAYEIEEVGFLGHRQVKRRT